ncbi:hypothetical protein P8C59_007986 [Phyllachora maydis]|uniref:Uncharacterized protein n=1 Tax=Phyllachora maydis TaxID=1825666 RepID=A0AAD9IAJ9_9PEZI|nr:hypothetical protein P8C59_007986 [Phyllachora maydis]
MIVPAAASSAAVHMTSPRNTLGSPGLLRNCAVGQSAYVDCHTDSASARSPSPYVYTQALLLSQSVQRSVLSNKSRPKHVSSSRTSTPTAASPRTTHPGLPYVIFLGWLAVCTTPAQREEVMESRGRAALCISEEHGCKEGQQASPWSQRLRDPLPL